MPAPLFESTDRARAAAFSRLAWCNPFHTERAELERQALGDAWQPVPGRVEWVGGLPVPPPNPNTPMLAALANSLASKARGKLLHRAPSPRECEIYRDLVVFAVFYRYAGDFQKLILQARERGAGSLRCPFYDRYRTDIEHWFPPNKAELRLDIQAERLFACFFQVRRAYAHIHEFIIGASPAARQLRERVWQSIFTRDMARFQRTLVERMGDLITLVTGPSGSGKELVARAIGLSRHIPFDASRREFAADYLRGFYAINLAALSPTLIESELFGHRRGAFTGALGDRQGYLEVCGPHGTVFLDEIGETDPAIQVKLLRVLQTRGFQRIGDTEPRRFEGKVLAATNRDLTAEMRAGRFREDLYYRLCADHVHTPALREILRGSPEELATLVYHIAARLGGAVEADALTNEACAALQRGLPPDYAWPGNFRELEQAVRNILIHGDYAPPALDDSGYNAEGAGTNPADNSPEDLANALKSGQWTADELLGRYVRRVYRLSGSYEEAARRLALDRRTVKRYLRLDADASSTPHPGMSPPAGR